jgi:hypothetical protein
MRRTRCLTCCLLFAGVWPLHAQTSVKDKLLANERRFSESQIQRKCDGAAQLLAENFQGISGLTNSKSDFLNACKTGALITTIEKFSNVEFRLHTPNIAVMAYLDDGDFILNNKPAGTLNSRIITDHLRLTAAPRTPPRPPQHGNVRVTLIPGRARRFRPCSVANEERRAVRSDTTPKNPDHPNIGAVPVY